MPSPESETPARAWIARAFSLAEDLVYIGLGVILAGSAIVLLISGLITFGQVLFAGTLPANIVNLLDRILLILLVVELLYTVLVSFREHAVVPEPFLLIGLIAVIRRILVLTTEFGQTAVKTGPMVQYFALELAALTALIVALSVSLLILRRRDTVSVAKRP